MPYMIPWERTAERRGRRKGREEGREEEKKATAKNLLGMGIDIDKIVKATGLQKEVVEALRVKSN